MKNTYNIGIVGCGKISGIYFENLCGRQWSDVQVIACSDLDEKKAAIAAAEHEGVQAMTTDELIAHPDVDIVLNLTIPAAHFPVSMQAVQAGKHVYAEKPITENTDQANQLLAAAEKADVRVGNAPDTFLGAGIQTAAKLVSDGWIGTPVAATAFLLCRGHETWHPSPEFYYQPGGGPMFDMGPYYLTAMIEMLGPVARVMGSAQTTFNERTITSEPLYGKTITVNVPTHVTGLLEFECGAVGTIITSFDSASPNLPRIEVIGTDGCLTVPDPNTFGGDVLLKRQDEYCKMPHIHDISENARGLGVRDMARAIRENRPHRANGARALHVLEIMEKIHLSADAGKRLTIESKS